MCTQNHYWAQFAATDRQAVPRTLNSAEAIPVDTVVIIRSTPLSTLAFICNIVMAYFILYHTLTNRLF
jgi:hypothetical protein